MLTLVLVIGAVAIVSSAADDDYVCQVGTTKYTSIYDAYMSLDSSKGGTITLIKDATIDTAFGKGDGKNGTINERRNNVIFDLNGYTLTTTANRAIQNHYNYNFSFVGEGEIIAKNGAFVSTHSDSADGTIKVIGTGKGIKITSTNEPIYGHRGNFVFENVDFNITMNSAAGAFTGGRSSETNGFRSANYSFNNCTVNLTQTVNSSSVPVFSYNSGAKTGSIKITNSYFKFSGPLVSNFNSTVANAFVVENSVLIQELSPAQVKDSSTDGRKTNFLYGAPNGGFNFKNSYITYAFRFLSADSTVNLVNSKLNFSATPWELTGGDNMIARYGTVNFDKDSELVASSMYNISMNTTEAKLVFAEGARVNHATKFKAANVFFPDGSATNASTTYKFMFDPAGDSDSPYVVVKADVASNLPAGTTYFNDFSDLRTVEVDGLIIDNGVNVNTYPATDKDGNPITATNSTGVFAQYNITTPKTTANSNGGSVVLENILGNRAIKYWVTPTETQTEGRRNISYDGTNSPCLFLTSTGNAYASNKVIVLSYDFATDSGAYPSHTVRLDAQGKENVKSQNLFTVSNNGTLTNKNLAKDATVADDYHNIGDLKASTTGWNRVTVIIYGETKQAHVYFNGMYVGSAKSYASDTAPNSVDGFRLDVGKEQPINSTILLDNFRNYGFTALAATDNVKDKINPGAYIEADVMNTLVSDTIVAGGNVYATLDDALKSGATVELFGDVKIAQTVKTNGTVITNGYNVNVNTASSIGYKAVNGIYTFDSSYNVKYAFQTGVDANGEFVFTEAEIYVNNIPKAPAGSISDKVYQKSEATGKYSAASLLGWSEHPNSTTPDTLVPVTMEDVEKYDGNAIYLYPVYGAYTDTGYDFVILDNATGEVKRGGTHEGELWGGTAWSLFNLQYGETLVLTSNLKMLGSLTNGSFTANGKEKVLGLDLNGFTIDYSPVGAATRKGNLWAVKAGETAHIYSSRPGGLITGEGYNDVNKGNAETQYTIGASGGEIFYMQPSGLTHEANNGNTNINSHITLGVYNGKYANNLTINACTAVAVQSGDKTCTVTIDGVKLERNSSDYMALVYTRFFYGTVTVKNSTLISAIDNALVGAHSKAYVQNSDGTYSYPANTFNVDNCVLIGKTNGGTIITCSEAVGTITFTNCVTNGKLANSSKTRNTLVIGENNLAYAMDENCLADGLYKAAYNTPITLESLGFVGDKITVPYIYVKKTAAGTLASVIEYLTYTYTANAVEGGDTVLGTYFWKSTSDVVTVTVAGLGDNEAKTVVYANGGNFVAADLPTVENATLNAITLVHDGKYVENMPNVVTENVTLTPTYEIKSNIEGVKVNLSIYSDFVINLYIPVAYKNYIASITDGTDVLNTSEVTLEDGEYIKVVIKRASNEATTDAVFTINLAEGEYTKAVNVTVSIASYAEAILKGESYTKADKQLMYYMLTYANEAYKYFGDKTNYDAAITALLTTYADAKGEGMAPQTYAKAIENLAFGTVITEATVNLGAAPAFVFTVAEGFDGTITVTYAGNTKELVVKDGKAVVNGMKVYNFGADVTVTAVGTVNGEAVTETATYNLDTFVKYHVNNDAPESVACVDLLKALYDYVACADLYTK